MLFVTAVCVSLLCVLGLLLLLCVRQFVVVVLAGNGRNPPLSHLMSTDAATFYQVLLIMSVRVPLLPLIYHGEP